MRLTRRDAVATVLFAAVIVPYIGYVMRGSMPYIQDPRGMAAVGIVGLALALFAWGFRATFTRVLAVVGVALIGLGATAALIGAEGSEILLAFFIGGVALLWAVETLFDFGIFARTHAPPA